MTDYIAQSGRTAFAHIAGFLHIAHFRIETLLASPIGGGPIKMGPRIATEADIMGVPGGPGRGGE